MDITSILCVSYIVLFVGYMNIGIIRDKVSPVVLLSFVTYLTVSYDKNSLFDKILENSMSSVFVSLYLVSIISYILSRGSCFKIIITWFSCIHSQLVFSIVILLFTLITSGFLNNAMIVGLFIPMIQQICQNKRWNASNYLLPISFVSMLGGTTTLIGSSTNLIAYEILQPQIKLTLFSMWKYSFLTGIVGVIFLLRYSHNILDNRDSVYLSTYVYNIPENSGYHNVELKSTPLQQIHNQLCVIVRDNRFITMPVQSNQILKTNDQLVYISTSSSQKSPNKSFNIEEGDIDLEHDSKTLDKMPKVYIYRGAINSYLEGKTCSDIGLKKKYGIVVLAIIRNNSILRNHISNIIFTKDDEIIFATLIAKSISDFDELFIQTRSIEFSNIRTDDQDNTINSKDYLAIFIALSFIINSIIGKISYAWFGLFLIIIWRTTDIFSRMIGCNRLGLSIEDMKSVWSAQMTVFIIIYSSLIFTESIKTTQLYNTLYDSLGERIGNVLQNKDSWGVFLGDKSVSFFVLCIVIHLIVSAISLIFSNAATVSLFLTILVDIIKKYHIDIDSARHLALIIIHGGSSCFASPIGYHTNVMVSQYSNYQCGDFLKLGIPLHILSSIVFSFLILAF